MASEALTVLRDRLTSYLDASHEAAMTRELVAGFRQAHGSEIAAATADLQDLALTKLFDGVSRRRKTTGDPRQGDFFRAASVPHAIVVPVTVGDRVQRVRKPFLNVTFQEAQAYLDRKPPTRAPKPDAGVTAILDRIRPYMTSPEQTIAQGLAALEAAERAQAIAEEPTAWPA